MKCVVCELRKTNVYRESSAWVLVIYFLKQNTFFCQCIYSRYRLFIAAENVTDWIATLHCLQGTPIPHGGSVNTDRRKTQGSTATYIVTRNQRIDERIQRYWETPRMGKCTLARHHIETVSASPSNSAWASPTVVVSKAHGELRMCVDYRPLNAATKRDAHPLGWKIFQTS